MSSRRVQIARAIAICRVLAACCVVLTTNCCGCNRVSEDLGSARAGHLDIREMSDANLRSKEAVILIDDVAQQEPVEVTTTSDTTADAIPQSEPLCEKVTLPQHGQGCNKLGQLRCTNAGAGLTSLMMKFCHRPNALECQTNSDGTMSWQQVSCSHKVPDSKCGQKASCMIWGDAHVCQPTLFNGEGTINLGTVTQDVPITQVCPESSGWGACTGTIRRCTTLASLGPLAAETQKGYGECGKFLEQGQYIFYTEACNKEIVCECKTGANQPGPCSKVIYFTGCAKDALPNQPKCQETCKDVGAPGY